MCLHLNVRAEQKYITCSHTGFQNGLVDFNLASDWLLEVQVRRVREGFGAGWTGVTVGHAFNRTGCPPRVDVIKHSNQLEKVQNNCRLLNTPKTTKITPWNQAAFLEVKMKWNENRILDIMIMLESRARVDGPTAGYYHASGTAACIILPCAYVQERKEMDFLQIWSSWTAQLFSTQSWPAMWQWTWTARRGVCVRMKSVVKWDLTREWEAVTHNDTAAVMRWGQTHERGMEGRGMTNNSNWDRDMVAEWRCVYVCVFV